MASMVIRNIPEEIVVRLKETARREGKSAEQVAREALAARVLPSRHEAIREIDSIRAKSRRTGQDEIDRILEESRAERDRDLI